MSEDQRQPFTKEWAERNLKAAKHLAEAIHVTTMGQMYFTLPYTFHLQHVENVVQRFFKSDKPRTYYLRIAAWLHDICEDTVFTIESVRSAFGDNVADIVWRVTDEPGESREERKQKTYLKIKESEEAVILKLADRIANVENGHSWEGSRLVKYRDEHVEFKKQLYNEDHCAKTKRMWVYLDLLLS